MWIALLALSMVAQAEEAQTVTVEFQTNAKKLVVSKVDSTASFTSSTGATAAAVASSELCIAPCRIDLEPGMYQFFGRGGGQYVKAERFTVDQNTVLEAKSGSIGMRSGSNYLIYLGATAALTGGMLLGASADLPELRTTGALITGAGVGALGIAIPLRVASRSSWEKR